MNNLSIKSRLIGLVAVLLTLLVASACFTVYRMTQSNAQLGSLYSDRVIPLKQLKDVADGYFVGVVDTAHKTRDGNMSAADGLKTIAAARVTISRNWNAYLATTLVDEEKRLLVPMEAAMKKADGAVQRVNDLLQRNDLEGLRSFTARELYPVVDPLADTVNALMAVQLTEAEREFKAAQAEYTTVLWVNIVAASLTVLIAALFAWRLITRITGGIGEAVKVAQTVSAGDLTSYIEVKSHDETGQLMQALKTMNESLFRVVSQVRNSADSIATGSAQIATGNIDLSQRTEEQASNLQQTASSMEQITTTVQQSADTARQARQLASSASAVASQGGQVMGEVISTMDDISASSKKIADIIGVIDGIAFQTNILALNAAVEAARAGEQGRGFAVVAGEVRTLAQRSAQAAREIKTLIGESVGKVTSGSRLVSDAGQTMNEIVMQVKQVTDLIGEISAASAEQSAGIGQVGQAVQQLDQVTQQNAALVEESAAATESLKHQASTLADAVAVFRLN